MRCDAAEPALTDREQQLVAALVDGLSNREIAAALGVKEQTVRNQLCVLFEKFDVSSRLALAMRAVERGLAFPSLAPPSGSQAARG